MSSPAYGSTAAASDRVAWTLDDVLSETDRFDFSRPFLPSALAGEDELPFLGRDDRRLLNQIRAHGYLRMFGLVEAFILPFVLGQAKARLGGESSEVRSLLQFASEEAKHITLFERFAGAFERGFGRSPKVIGPPEAIAEHVLAHSELGVGLLILHIEWMTQRHYVEMVRDARAIEPRFRSLLHHHWLEESQHARIDGWIVERLASELSESERSRAVDEYLALAVFLDGGLEQQVALDIEELESSTRTRLDRDDREILGAHQHRSQRKTYLGSGMTHPKFREVAGRIHTTACDRIDAIANTLL